MLGSVSSGLKVSAMNAPWMNIAGSPLPATSYSSSAPSVLALSNVASLSAPRRHRESAAEACSLRPHSTRGYAFGRPGLRESSLRLWPYSPECVEGGFPEVNIQDVASPSPLATLWSLQDFSAPQTRPPYVAGVHKDAPEWMSSILSELRRRHEEG